MSDALFDPSATEAAPDAPTGGGRDAVVAAMPLAARMRPRSLDEFVGQTDTLGEGAPLRTMLARGGLTSLILWGPPGSGKTSLAYVVAGEVGAHRRPASTTLPGGRAERSPGRDSGEPSKTAGTHAAAWRSLSAVTAGVKDVRAIIDEARTRLETVGRRTVLFIDEIHRFNKGQQDALLPGVEEGSVVLVGATTENPFFELNAPLLSRCRLVRLDALTEVDVRTIVERALADPERGYGGAHAVTDDALDHLVAVADGDARTALNTVEIAIEGREAGEEGPITAHAVDQAMRRFYYDKAADSHYDQVSAFIKSLRGSDPDAAVYWLLRMLESGEDPRFLARRMVIFASEDVGLADRGALPLAVAAFEALDRVGLPEARHNLVHAAIALAAAPKSNAVARALSAGLGLVRETGNAPVPPHLRDAHYRGAQRLGHGEGYDYPHDHPEGFVAQQYLPDAIDGTRLYDPTRHGHEAAVADRLERLRDTPRHGRGGSEGSEDTR